MIVLHILFWLGVAWVAYVFVLYPVGIWLLARIRPRPLNLVETPLPRVAFVMAAYNEEKIIADRLQNYLDLDYPRELLEFHVGSDGSSDMTDEIIESFSRRDPSIHLYRYHRVGKTQIIYELGEKVDAELIVFTDADVLVDSAALNSVVRCFGDPQVGGVVGNVQFRDLRNTAGSSGERKFTQWESGLRRYESLVWTTVAPTGQCFAVRRGAYTPLTNYKLSDDLNLSITIPLNGYRVWYEPRLVISETNRRSLESEVKRRLRMGRQSTATYMAFDETRLPWRSAVGFQIWSHKLMRNLAAAPAFLVLVTSILLAWSHPLYAAAAIICLGWLALVLIGLAAEKAGLDFPVLLYPLYFTAMVVSLTIGSMRAATSGGLEMWNSPRLE